MQIRSNTWAVFSPVHIDRGVPRVYNIMSVYLRIPLSLTFLCCGICWKDINLLSHRPQFLLISKQSLVVTVLVSVEPLN